eukprot:RCo051331
MRWGLEAVLAVVVALAAVGVSAETFFRETFDDESWEKRWVQSEWKSPMGHWKWTAGDWPADPKLNLGLQTMDDMHHHAISAKLERPFSNRGKPLVVQFTVKNERKEYAFCGGGYVKLLPSGLDQKKFGGESDYSIMFGPDLCGYDVSRIHLIFTYKGKNLLKKDEMKLEYADKDEFTHVYKMVLNPDNTVAVYFDGTEKYKGSLLEGWDFPPATLDDPADQKPSDWVDEKEIPDPTDKKPEKEVPEMIPDPDATKPDEWDDDLDGEWEPPLVKNPEFTGEWKPRMIPNPAYKGEWKAKQLPNPDYNPDVYVYDDLAYVGFELWTVNNGTIFDNIIVTDNEEAADQLRKETSDKFV